MCDNPKTNPWEVLINPAVVGTVLTHIQNIVQEKGIEHLVKEIPELADVPHEDLKKFVKGVVSERGTSERIAEQDLAHIEFDVSRLKNLPERELEELLQRKLPTRIIQDIKKLEVKRPIPDWCYAFF